MERLDVYSLMTIFDFLSIDDLTSVAEAYPRFNDIISERYIVAKFGFNEPIYISVEFLYNYFLRAHTENRVLFDKCHPKRFQRILKQFGHIVSHITIAVVNFAHSDSQDFFKYVEDHCKNATKEIIIHFPDTRALAHWTHSFDQTVTKIAIPGYRRQAFPFSTLFPYMQQLTVENVLGSEVQHYPYLTNCSFLSTDDDANDNKVIEFIRLNPQLRHLYTSIRSQISYVKFLSETLPDLESLAIRIDTVRGVELNEIIRFKNVKKFSLRLAHYHNTFRLVTPNIHFDQLKVLELNTVREEFAPDNFIEFIAMNRGLKKIQTDVRMTPTIFNDLLQQLPELEEISITLYTRMVDSWGAFFTGNHGLKKITIDNCYGVGSNAFKDIVRLNWAIVYNEGKVFSISFIRMY